MKIHNAPSTLKSEQAIAIASENWEKESAIPGFISEKCQSIMLHMLRKSNFDKSAFREAYNYARKVAYLLTGLMASGAATESDISDLRNDEAILLFLRNKLGYVTFEIILKAPTKKKYLQQANQVATWRILNSLYANIPHWLSIKDPIVYLNNYKQLLTDIKARMTLAEIIDTHIQAFPKSKESREYASRFYSYNHTSPDDEPHLRYTTIFSYIIVEAYKSAMAIDDIKTIEDFEAFKNYCNNLPVVTNSLTEFIVRTTGNEKISDAILALPELKIYYTKLHEIVNEQTMRKFISYIGDGKTHLDIMSGLISDIVKWMIYYKNNTPNAAGIVYDNYFKIPKLSSLLKNISSNDLVDMIGGYPHLAVFMDLYDLVFYMIAEEDENRKQEVLAFVNTDMLIRAFSVLETKYSVTDIIKRYRSGEGENISLKVLIDLNNPSNRNHSLPEKSRANKINNRANIFVRYALRNLSFDTAMLLIDIMSRGNNNMDNILPSEYRAFLWYSFKNSKANISCPNKLLEHIKQQDIESSIRYKQSIANDDMATASVITKEEEEAELVEFEEIKEAVADDSR